MLIRVNTPLLQLKHRVLALLLMLLCVCGMADAQSDAQFTQYWAVPAYYNPAATGLIDFVNIHAGTRMQWVGIPRAPQDFVVLADSPFKIGRKRFGAGVVMGQESIGLFSTSTLSAQLSYKMKIFGGVLSFGAQVGLVDQSFDGTKVVLPNGEGSDSDTDGDTSSSSSTGSDTGVPQSEVTGSAFDFSAGAHFEHKYFWAGVSATHVTQPAISLRAGENDDKAYEAEIGSMYYFMCGSNIPMKNTLFELQPSLLMRSNLKFTQADITMRAVYNKLFSVGVAYRTSDAVSLLLGVNYKNFFFGYSYDYATTAISHASSGSHEIFGGYKVKLNLGEKNRNRQKSIRIM